MKILRHKHNLLISSSVGFDHLDKYLSEIFMNTYRDEGTSRRKEFQSKVISSLICDFLFKWRFPFSHMLCLFKTTLFSEKLLLHTSSEYLLWYNSSFLEQLFLQSSSYFWGSPFSKQSLLRSSCLFQNIYFFREKLLPSKHFLRIGSYLGKLIFGTANFLVEELFRIKISTEELVFWSRYFCTASTFSEELKYSIPYYQLLLESCLFRGATFSKEATFYSNYLSRKAMFLQHSFTESYYFTATFSIYELVIK